MLATRFGNNSSPRQIKLETSIAAIDLRVDNRLATQSKVDAMIMVDARAGGGYGDGCNAGDDRK